MGGKATEQYQTKRMSQEVYEKITNYFNNYQEEGELFAIPFSYKDKDTHGDVDLLTTMDLEKLFEKILLDPNLEVNQEYLRNIKNNGVNPHINHLPIRLTIEGNKTDWFQLDVIRAKPEDFECTFRYYCYNDLGNMIGRIAYGLGLDFGQSGLTYKFPKDHIFRKELGKQGDLIITKDYFKAIKYLGLEGLNKENFNDYFKNKEDIFNFIYNSKNMNPYAFLNVLKRSKSKIRDRKRKTLNEFLEFLIEKGDLTREEVDSVDFEIFKNNKQVQSMLEEKPVEVVNQFKPDIPYSTQIKKMSLLLIKKNIEKEYKKIFSIESFKDKLNEEDYQFISEAKWKLQEKYAKDKLGLIKSVKENIEIRELIEKELFYQIIQEKNQHLKIESNESFKNFIKRNRVIQPTEKLNEFIDKNHKEIKYESIFDTPKFKTNYKKLID